VNWTAVWVVWIVVVLGMFGVIEWWGLRKDGTGGTLSYLMWTVLFKDHAKRLDGKYPKQPRGVIFFLVLGPFVWLLFHFFLGGRIG